jgi:hypothetical protein
MEQGFRYRRTVPWAGGRARPSTLRRRGVFLRRWPSCVTEGFLSLSDAGLTLPVGWRGLTLPSALFRRTLCLRRGRPHQADPSGCRTEQTTHLVRRNPQWGPPLGRTSKAKALPFLSAGHANVAGTRRCAVPYAPRNGRAEAKRPSHAVSTHAASPPRGSGG